MTSDDIAARLRAVLHNDRSVELMNRESADEIERLRAHVRALEIEIERYRIQCVHVMDLQRLLEVQDKQLECAQKALQILEAANGRDAAPEGCDRGARSLSGAFRHGDAG